MTSPQQHPPRPTRPRAALFDYDGTLFDTDNAHWHCWDAALREFGGVCPHDTYYHDCAGKLTLAIAAYLIESQGLHATPSEVAAAKEFRLRAWMRDTPLMWMADAEESFHRFRTAGLALAVVTSSPRDIVTAGLQQHGLLDSLTAIITREDVTRSKPAPDCYRLGVERVGIPTDACVAFEDTSTGVNAAAAAGLRCIAVRPPHAGPQDFSAADRVFTTLRAPTDWLLEC